MKYVESTYSSPAASTAGGPRTRPEGGSGARRRGYRCWGSSSQERGQLDSGGHIDLKTGDLTSPAAAAVRDGVAAAGSQ